MRCGKTGISLVAIALLALAGGCKKSSAPPAGPPPVETVARLHWVGKHKLEADPAATNFISIWNLPESARLQAQTLDKLALAPWLLGRGPAASNGAPAPLLRALLDDLVQREACLEIRNATNLPGELVLAVRLADDRAALWRTNLATVLQSLTGLEPAADTNGGWTLRKHDTPNRLDLARAGEWTLVGLANDTNTLLPEIAARIARAGSPVPNPATNAWISADLNLPRAAAALGLNWRLPKDWPAISLNLEPKGDAVRTAGHLKFPRPLPFTLDPWNVPTNLISEPLVSFTALRGVQPWLSSLPLWQQFQAGPFPNQLFFWACDGLPFLSFFAAPSADATSTVEIISSKLVTDGNTWLAEQGTGKFLKLTNANGVVWSDAMMLAPHIKVAGSAEGPFIFGGLLPMKGSNLPMPAELLGQFMGRDDIVAYDWEMTAPRIEQLLYSSQLIRLLLNKAQVPPPSASVAWLRALENVLGNCGTVVTRTGPDRLDFTRNSTMGLSAVELHLLVDWLESPLFPKGLNTFLGQPTPIPKPRPSRNASAPGTNPPPPAAPAQQ